MNQSPVGQGPVGFGGFSTASGKTIKVSSEALRKAKDLFKKIDDDITIASPAGSGSHLEEAFITSEEEVEMDQCQIPPEVIDEINQKPVGQAQGAVGFGGFSTASGKTIKISDEALRKAKDIFKKIDDDNGKKSMGIPQELPYSTSEEVEMDECQIPPGVTDEMNQRPVSQGAVGFGGFSTASGKTIKVSNEALRKAKDLFKKIDDDNAPVAYSTSKEVEMNQCQTKLTIHQSHAGTTSDRGPVNMSFGGFSTASGKNISVSDEALRKAKDIFKKIDDDNAQKSMGIRPEVAHSTSEAVEMDQCKSPQEIIGEMNQKLVGQGAVGFGGFSTASGKNISVSDEALRKAKDLFKKIDDDNSPVPHSTSEEVEMDEIPQEIIDIMLSDEMEMDHGLVPQDISSSSGEMPMEAEINHYDQVPQTVVADSTSSGEFELDHGPVTQEIIDSTLALLEDEDKCPFDSSRGFDDVFRIIHGAKFPETKTIPLIRAIIARLYPVVYMMKQPDKKSSDTYETYRSCELAVQERRKSYDANMSKLMEKMEDEVRSTLARQKASKPRMRKANYTKQQLDDMAPLDLLDWIENCADGDSISLLTISDHRLKQMELARADEYNRVKTDVGLKYESELSALRKTYPTTVRLLKIRLVDATATESQARNPANSAILSVWQSPEESLDMFEEGLCFEMKNVIPMESFSGYMQLSLTRSSGVRPYQNYDRSLVQLLQRESTPFSTIIDGEFSPWFGEMDTVGLVVYVAPFIPPNIQKVYFADEKKNIICVRFWSPLASLKLERVIEFAKIVVMKNLQCRSTSRNSKIFEAFAQESSTFTNFAKPNDVTMKRAWCFLRDNIGVYSPDVYRFAQTCEMKTYTILNSSSTATIPSATYTPLSANSSAATPAQHQVIEEPSDRLVPLNPNPNSNGNGLMKNLGNNNARTPRMPSPPRLQLPMSARVTKQFIVPRRSDAK